MMSKKKRIVIISAIVVACFIIIGIVYAFFSDTVTKHNKFKLLGTSLIKKLK